jgi:hypothetical protein
MATVVPWATKSTDDIFGILAIVNGLGTLADVLKIKGSTRTPIAKATAQALDEYGDIAAKSVPYGAATTMFEATSEFEVVSGTLDLSKLFLGVTATSGINITGVSIKTSNGAWPTVSITGNVGKVLEAAPTGKLNKWALPAISVVNRKVAQDFGGGGSAELGFDAPTGCKTTGSGLDFTVNFSETTDGEGLPVAFSIHGADGSMNADFVAVAEITTPNSFLPVWTVDVAAGFLWANLANPATAKTPNEYWTGSASATLADPATSLVRTSA